MGDGLHVFCGDTLFSGGCGRVFTGTMGELFDSMMRFNGLADDTLFYPAHEYTLSNLKFGHTVCADDFKMAIENAITDTKAKLSRGEISLPTTLSNERQINVFLQVYHEQMIDNIRGKYPLGDESPLSVFTALRELKNNFSDCYIHEYYFFDGIGIWYVDGCFCHRHRQGSNLSESQPCQSIEGGRVVWGEHPSLAGCLERRHKVGCLMWIIGWLLCCLDFWRLNSCAMHSKAMCRLKVISKPWRKVALDSC